MWVHENYGEKGTNHQALGYALDQRGTGGGAVVDTDKLLSGGEVGHEPAEKDGVVASGGGRGDQWREREWAGCCTTYVTVSSLVWKNERKDFPLSTVKVVQALLLELRSSLVVEKRALGYLGDRV